MSEFKGKMEDHFKFGGIANRRRGLQLLAIFISFSSTIATTGFRTSELQFSTKYNVTVPTAFFTQISLEKCWEECTARVACRAFNYYNLYKLCELDILGNLTDVSTSEPFEENGVVYWAKQELLATIPCGSKTCSLGQRCDKDTGACEIKECGPLNVSDDIVVHGNVNRIGSWIRLDCKDDYVPSLTIECGLDGHWTKNDVTCKRCEADWTLFQTSCYRLFSRDVKYEAAKSNCELVGAKLVSITSSTENDFIQSTFSPWYWIGANDKESEGSWKWETNETWSYENFFQDETKGDTNENCLIMTSEGWDDIDCNGNLKYVCEKRHRLNMCRS
ncbi:PGCB-like protein [Mya arenaria]|uniref:PGCB-like protein n=1 Tax=Mya arenaria TaxID=6604 RepID=A0ABY7F3H9_MYAAR|nr:versican core protein-like [Mya arenaria]WAR16732.1 PGCB-like protein [Mya arenaria]